MKKITVFYWIFTGIFSIAIAIGSVSDILSSPLSVEVFRKLGYPDYLSPFFGVARLLAILVVLLPLRSYPNLKEWAYAGLAFDLAGAVYSNIATHNPFSNWIFLVLSVLFYAGSYILYRKKINDLKQIKH